MAWTDAYLAAIEAALARGVTSVTYDGERVEYPSIADLLKLRAQMRAELGLSGEMGGRRYAIFDPGT